MISMKKALMVVAIASALSGCGKNDFNGTYSGYEQQISSNAQMASYDQRLELNLSHDDDIVSGSVSYPDSGMQGQFSATAENSDKLDNVEIRVGYSAALYQQNYSGANFSMGMNCFGVFTGSLEAIGDGKRLKGTLTTQNATNSTVGGHTTTCTGKSITVNKQ